MKQNMGRLDRTVRALLVAPAAVLTAVLVGPASVGGIALLVFATLMVVTAATGFCVLYVPLRVDTRGMGDTLLPPVTLSRFWWALMFVALGALGILHVAGVIDWSRTVGGWWPVAVVGWAVAEMVAVRRFSTMAALVAAIGIGLLADEQRWSGRGIVWSVVFVGIGLAILVGAARRRVPPATAVDRPADPADPADDREVAAVGTHRTG